MNTLHIHKLEAHYRLKPSWAGMQERLDGMLRAVLDEALELALEQDGISASDEICVREVKAPVRLRFSDPDQALILRWSEVLAGCIRQAVENGDSNTVIRYSSRLNGLVDFASGVASKNYSRAWAWSQLGFARLSQDTNDSEAAEQLVAAMTAESASVVPVLQAIARIQELHLLAVRLHREHWRRLAAAALAAVSARPAEILAVETNESMSTGEMQTRETERILALSSIAAAAIEYRKSFAEPAVPCSSLAAFVALEAEPDLFRRESRSVLRRMRALSAELNARLEMPSKFTASDTQEHVDRRVGQRPNDRKLELYSSRTGVENGVNGIRVEREYLSRESSPKETGQTKRDRISSFSASTATQSETKLPAPLGSRHIKESTNFVPDKWIDRSTGQTFSRPGAIRPPLPERPLAETRRVGRTAYGGLLFLLSPIDTLGMNDDLLDDARFKQRSLRWILHNLALHLTACEETDPAALAFCGLGPETELPWLDEPRADAEELEALEDAGFRIVAELRQRLAWDEGEADRLVSFVCGRRARIHADTGWLEIVMSLEDVSTDIRRAALDLDPGFLPWLGVVVTFRYE